MKFLTKHLIGMIVFQNESLASSIFIDKYPVTNKEYDEFTDFIEENGHIFVILMNQRVKSIDVILTGIRVTNLTIL